jgi:putative endopeptidase
MQTSKTILILSSFIFSSALAAVSSTPPALMIDPTAIDASVNPCQDFYQYACGNWIKRTPLPSDKPRYTRSFSVIDDRNLDILHTLLENDAHGKGSADQENSKKLGDYYASCMDAKTISAHSKNELKDVLAQIDAVTEKAGLTDLVAKLHAQGVPAFFSFSSASDIKQPTVFIAEVDQGGYALPDSTFYHSTDANKQKVATAYQKYIEKTFRLLGEKAAVANQAAKTVFKVESTLTANALPPENLQDPTLLYFPGTVDALHTATPAVQWEKYFSDLGIATPKKINISEAKFMKSVNGVIETTSLADLKTYLRFETVNALARYLDQKFYANWFAFNGATLNGQKEPEARWKQCLLNVSGGMGEAVGQAFVAKAFSAQAKDRIQKMIDHLRSALEKNLSQLVWLDSQTRKAAAEKLALITRKIGYPDHYRDYGKLEITRDSFLKNMLAASAFEEHRQLNKIGGPVDPLEWQMTPHEVNAYYEPTLNQINFPAGILQPPFFSEQAPDAINYGSIGMVIGHEMTHGFDTVGSKFDGHGKQNDWWSEQTKKLFDEKASCLEKQYSEFEPVKGLHVNGHLTVTENIADNGGLKIAFLAYQLAQKDESSDEQKLNEKRIAEVPNLNANQQFFLSAAQGWCTQQSEPSLRKQVSSNPHSPSQYRINGTMMNNADFAAAYQCSAGTPMAPKNRCAIW